MTSRPLEFDPSEYLDSDEMIVEYLSAALSENDPDLLLAAISTVARSKGMTELARSSGLGRESLFKTLSPGSKPRFETVVRILRALGVRFSIEPDRSSSVEKIPA